MPKKLINNQLLQPAQKCLKDHKDRTLDFEDIFHYQKIIVALDLTADFMEQLEEVMNDENSQILKYSTVKYSNTQQSITQLTNNGKN